VFLHGWGGALSAFKGTFEALKRHAHVVNLELPGFGQSPPPARPWGITDYARLVRGFIGAVCGGGAVTLIGHSFGGRIALILAATCPDIVEKAVLIDCAGLKPRRGLRYVCRRLRYACAKISVKLRLRGADGLNGYGSADYRVLTGVMRATFVRVIGFHLPLYARAVTQPTLLIWGGRDRDTPPYMARKLRRLIPNSRLKIFPYAGHYAYIDEFKAVNRLIVEFIEGELPAPLPRAPLE
jgi:pimeloyl-ACP methyl ester carboxylesterase